ncbi:MAG TPA: DoxX family protein [Terriglobales bacterium]|nr:DoxX family protein [Terriglobales bacterium]
MTQAAPASKSMLWAGRVISGLVILMMLFDATIKVIKLPAAVDGTARLGHPAGRLVPIGLAALVCVIGYAIPRTSVLGAILLTGYFGSATATQVREQDPWFLFPIFLGVLVWLGLFCVVAVCAP